MDPYVGKEFSEGCESIWEEPYEETGAAFTDGSGESGCEYPADTGAELKDCCWGAVLIGSWLAPAEDGKGAGDPYEEAELTEDCGEPYESWAGATAAWGEP